MSEANDPIAAAITAFLSAQGIPADHPETARTPGRVAQLWRESLLDGYQHSPADILSRTMPDTSGGIITVTHLPFHTICPHHLMPAYGVVHLAYQAGGQIVGFGVLQRLVDALAHRLILQEHLTQQLANALMTHLGAQGAIVAIHARHLCMILQGRNPQNAQVITRFGCGTLDGRLDLLPPLTDG